MKGLHPDFWKKPDREIFKYIEGSDVDSDAYKYSFKILELRHSKRLVWATWALVIATLLLLLSSVFQLYFTILK